MSVPLLPYRPRFHLTPSVGWLNDPVGFIFSQGAWHIFYQYHPHSPSWGPMHWGHAVSSDLLHWSHKPIALAPDKSYDQGGCFSGSAIESQSGELALMYTGVFKETVSSPPLQMQCLAYSMDRTHFVKHAQNPVITNLQIPKGSSKTDFRDPRVFRHNALYYCLVGSCDTHGFGHVLLYQSQDLIKWSFCGIPAKSNGHWGKVWECPDLFTIDETDFLIVSPQFLPSKGDHYHNIHSSICFAGKMHWTKAHFEIQKVFPLDDGFDFYAPQTTAGPDTERILIGWMDMWERPHPTAELGFGWTGALTLPRQLTWENNQLRQNPIKQLETLRTTPVVYHWQKTHAFSFTQQSASFELILEVDLTEKLDFALNLFYNRDTQERLQIQCDCHHKQILLNKTDAGYGFKGIRQTPFTLKKNRLKLHIVSDQSTVEIYINDGDSVMSSRIFSHPGSQLIEITAPEPGVPMHLKYWILEV